MLQAPFLSGGSRIEMAQRPRSQPVSRLESCGLNVNLNNCERIKIAKGQLKSGVRGPGFLPTLDPPDELH